MDGAARIAATSIGIGLAVLGLKALAWWLTGSAALYSDALESTVNVAASLLAFGAIRLAAKPPDADHPYGHDKVEFFAAVIEGALIIVAALLILHEAWRGWSQPAPLQAPWLGLGLNAVASVLNLAWAGVLLRNGRRHRSAALSADGRHLLGDVVTSVGIILGLSLAVLTGEALLDPLLAAATALWVLVSGLRVLWVSVGGLMDAAPPAEVVDRIRTLVGEHAVGAIEAHDLRMRHTGKVTFLEFHLVVPGEMRVADAHAICDRIEIALRDEMGGMTVTIHVEPEVKAKHTGVVVL